MKEGGMGTHNTLHEVCAPPKIFCQIQKSLPCQIERGYVIKISYKLNVNHIFPNYDALSVLIPQNQKKLNTSSERFNKKLSIWLGANLTHLAKIVLRRLIDLFNALNGTFAP